MEETRKLAHIEIIDWIKPIEGADKIEVCGILGWECVIAKKDNLEEILRKNPTLTIQGEQGDTRVQGNKYGITEPTMWVFNIIDHERNYHYSYRELEAFCKDHNLDYVKLVGFGYYKISDLGSTVQELVEFSRGKSLLNTSIPREGVVIRCIEDGKKLLSFKVINSDFLLKYNE